MTTARNRYYLNKRDGKVFGVCAGFADYLGTEALWVRVALVLLTILGSGITIPLYLAVAFLASRRPEGVLDRYVYDDEERAYERARRHGTMARTRSDISDMDRRLTDVESHYATNSRLADEIDRLR